MPENTHKLEPTDTELKTLQFQLARLKVYGAEYVTNQDQRVINGIVGKIFATHS